jgi:predicted DNA repair protein MutK
MESRQRDFVEILREQMENPKKLTAPQSALYISSFITGYVTCLLTFVGIYLVFAVFHSIVLPWTEKNLTRMPWSPIHAKDVENMRIVDATKAHWPFDSWIKPNDVYHVTLENNVTFYMTVMKYPKTLLR